MYLFGLDQDMLAPVRRVALVLVIVYLGMELWGRLVLWLMATQTEQVTKAAAWGFLLVLMSFITWVTWRPMRGYDDRLPKTAAWSPWQL